MSALASCATEREIPENKSFSASAWLLPIRVLYLNQYYFHRGTHWWVRMANPEHVEILKQGVEVWNQWREYYSEMRPDLSNLNLSQVILVGINFSHANLSGATLHSACLSQANCYGADLSETDFKNAKLNEVNFSDATFIGANLSDTHLNRANFSGADLTNSNLWNADLSEANLGSASLIRVNLSYTNLKGTDFNDAMCSHTIFLDLDLSETKGLETVDHFSASSLSINTLFHSKGKISEIFLRGCGVPETLITFLPSMLEEAIQFYSCFISYSHKDKEFAKRLHDRLQGIGIRCWLDEHQLKPGDELHKTIYEGIRVYDKVILCCSETALQSWWVEKEFKNAISKEEDYTETVLIPITLDDYLFKQSADNWTVGEIKRRFVQDFSNWKDHDAFEAAFKKVVDALRTDGGKPPPPASKLTRRKP